MNISNSENILPASEIEANNMDMSDSSKYMYFFILTFIGNSSLLYSPQRETAPYAVTSTPCIVLNNEGQELVKKFKLDKSICLGQLNMQLHIFFHKVFGQKECQKGVTQKGGAGIRQCGNTQCYQPEHMSCAHCTEHILELAAKAPPKDLQAFNLL